VTSKYNQHNAMNPLLYLTYPFSGVFILSLAIGLGVFLTRRFDLGWRLFWIGAATFILSQVGHIPFNAGLTALFRNGVLPAPPAAWQLPFNVVVLGLSAGLFEELARYAAYRWWAKEARSWAQGLLLGAGHGGIEAMLVGGLLLLIFVVMVALSGAQDLSRFLPPEQLPLLQQQMDAYWSTTWYDSLLGAVERAFTLPAHLAMSAMVLQVFTRGQSRWLWFAVGWHTLLDAAILYTAATWGVYAAEAVLGLLAAASIAILLALRRPEPQLPAGPELLSPPNPDLFTQLRPPAESPENLDGTRYSG
jgi:uncharacterized membrane protein YhfC